MTRKTSYKKTNHARRVSQVDSYYGSWKMMWFVRCVMKDGKYSIAYNQFRAAMDIVVNKVNPANMTEEQRKEAAIEIFEQVLKKVRPLAKVTTKRIGGANYQVPEQVPELLGERLAIKWIIKHARKRTGKAFYHKLSSEILDVVEGRGGALNERETAHKMAQANLAFGGKSSFFEEEQAS